jgi:hypothetical protein
MAVEYFTHTISRLRLEELQKAIDEKLADGCELVKESAETSKSGRLYSPQSRRFDSYIAPKYTCVVRKEKSKVKAGRNGR